MAAAGGRGRLRASHADREQVIATLKIAFVQGRLTKDEFDARVGQAFASRTYAELAAPTADIPAGLTEAPLLRPPARARAGPPMKKVVISCAGGVIAPAVVLVAFLTGNEPLFASFILPAIITFTAWIVAGAVMLDSLHEKRSRGQLPPRPGQRGRALPGDQDDRIGGDLTLFEARRDVRTGPGMIGPLLPGH